MMQTDVPQPTGAKLQDSLLQDSITKVLRRKNPTRVAPTDNLKITLTKLKNAGHGCVLVEEDGRLVGVLSERDVLYKVAGIEKDLSKVAVRDVMTANPVSIACDASIGFAVNKMAVGGFRHLPVMDEGKTVGVVSIKDVLAFFKKHL